MTRPPTDQQLSEEKKSRLEAFARQCIINSGGDPDERGEIGTRTHLDARPDRVRRAEAKMWRENERQERARI